MARITPKMEVVAQCGATTEALKALRNANGITMEVASKWDELSADHRKSALNRRDDLVIQAMNIIMETMPLTFNIRVQRQDRD